MVDGRTHHAECWRDHHDCAVARLDAMSAPTLARHVEGLDPCSCGSPPAVFVLASGPSLVFRVACPECWRSASPHWAAHVEQGRLEWQRMHRDRTEGWP